MGDRICRRKAIDSELRQKRYHVIYNAALGGYGRFLSSELKIKIHCMDSCPLKNPKYRYRAFCDRYPQFLPISAKYFPIPRNNC